MVNVHLTYHDWCGLNIKVRSTLNSSARTSKGEGAKVLELQLDNFFDHLMSFPVPLVSFSAVFKPYV